ncbi:hypothetical protein DUNSADRAFT_1793 [Dunaliella salina]|uniref:Uncharacterized protein n=1 Tax=Dunaliella salina TaxID=3046 RepID=A0ABQ7GWM6_DUNSA|nr:hypothetical protein DUNSADRAFT_1793 [Dunaliella salina]|eukprot:KAF5839016.1 hypothetical protein DUNSADRAFT_1793 [Dunaliella salina]
MHDQAIDVLRSGLNMFPENQGIHFARLMAMMASIETDRSNWGEALSCSQLAASALKGTDVGADPMTAPTLLSCGSMMLRALLVQGQDAEAKAAADSTADALAGLGASSGAARAASLGLRLASRHAAGDWEPASKLAEQLASASSQQSLSAAQQHGAPSLGLAQSFAALGQWHAAQRGAGPEAEADAQTAFSQGVQPWHSGSLKGLEDAEARAACFVGQAGLAIRASQWEQAEECLGQALQVAEGISSDTHPRVVPILTQLGYVYSRSARVTFAEGLYRECAKILKLDASRSTTWNLQPSPLHPNLVAMMAWRFHQLLAVMPNRGNEASAWEHLAQAMWAKTGAFGGEDSLSTVFGGAKHLSGQDHAGAGTVVALQLRRNLSVHFGMGV